MTLAAFVSWPISLWLLFRQLLDISLVPPTAVGIAMRGPAASEVPGFRRLECGQRYGVTRGFHLTLRSALTGDGRFDSPKLHTGARISQYRYDSLRLQ